MKRYSDIVGDGGSDLLGQVMAQRAAIDAALEKVEHRLSLIHI